ncbi:MAG: mftR, partial [Aeromicrobium sp.]|nr:mftR [Aeromicrobium sp.]
RYEAWRAVIADFVAARSGTRPDDLLARLVGNVSLAIAVSSYEIWLQDPTSELTDVLREAMATLESYLL